MNPLEEMLANVAAPNFYGDPDVEKRSQEVLRTGHVAAQAAPAPAIDWSKLGEMGLKSKLAELEAKFPPGLRHDRPYDVAESQYHDSSRQLTGEYGPVKGRPPMMRNPITGSPVPASPYISHEMLTAAANTLVEAKARARADIIRGRDTNDAAVEALAHAMGVDPTLVRGMPLELAGRVVPAVAQQQRAAEGERKKKADQETQRSEQQRGMDRVDPAAATSALGIQDPQDAWQMFGAARQVGAQQQKEKALEEKAALAEENKGKLAGAMGELEGMPPEEAAKQARGKLAPFLDSRGVHYQTLVGQFDTRAQQQQLKAQKDAQRAEVEQKKEAQRAEKEYATTITKPLDQVISAKPKSVKRASQKSGFGGGGEDEYDVNYHPAILDQMSALRVLAANARERDPQFDEKFASAVEMAKSRVPGDTFPAWMNDPKSALEGTGPIDDKDPAKTHAALVMIGLALRSLLGQQSR